MIPWKQNCPHIDEGWCVQCISRLGDAIEEYLENDGSRGRCDSIALARARLEVDAAMCNMPKTNEIPNPTLAGVDGLGTGCACVSHDATTCATIRDHLDLDDQDFGRRRCECCCHDEYAEYDEF
jgi:hypothetical protein